MMKKIILSLLYFSLVLSIDVKSQSVFTQRIIEKLNAIDNVVNIEELRKHPDFGKEKLKDSTGNLMPFIELVDRRDEFSTQFAIAGTNQFCKRQSDFPLHYKDANGNWRNIETVLEASATDPSKFEIKKQTFPISYNSKNGEASLTVDRTGNLLGLSKNIQYYQIDKNKNILKKEQQNSGSTSSVSTKEATIKNYFPNVDFKHEFEEHGVKTSFIINEKSAVNPSSEYVVFSEEINIPNGWSVKRDPKSKEVLRLYDEKGISKATMMTPFYYDSHKVTSADEKQAHQYFGTYNLIEKDGKYSVEMLVPTYWLLKSERVYPVVIDPNIIIDDYTVLGISQLNAWCAYDITITLPVAGNITNTRNYWEIAAVGGGWTNEQRTQVSSVAGTMGVYSGCCSAGGVQAYDVWSAIGNGSTGSRTYTHWGYNTWQNFGCATTIQYIQRRFTDVYYDAPPCGWTAQNLSTTHAGETRICLPADGSNLQVTTGSGTYQYFSLTAGRPYTFSVASNSPFSPSLSIYDANPAWSARASINAGVGTLDYTPTFTGEHILITNRVACQQWDGTTTSAILNIRDNAAISAGTLTVGGTNQIVVCAGGTVNFTISGSTGISRTWMGAVPSVGSTALSAGWNECSDCYDGQTSFSRQFNTPGIYLVRTHARNTCDNWNWGSLSDVWVSVRGNNPGAVSVPNPSCVGTPISINNVTVATSGSGGTPNYFFYYRGGPSNVGWQMYDGPTTNSSSALPSAVFNTAGSWFIARNSEFGSCGQANNSTTVDLPLVINAAPTLGTLSNAGPIDFCNASGNFTPVGATVTGQTGTVTWDYGWSNGAGGSEGGGWQIWGTPTLPNTCCFPPKTSASDGNADRIRYRVTQASCATLTSSTILVQNRFAPTPTITSSTSAYCVSSPPTITLTASFTSAPSNFGSLEWYSGACGTGTLLGTTNLTGTTTTTSYNFNVPTSPTTAGTYSYFVRYNPNSTLGSCGVLCSGAATVRVDAVSALGTPSATEVNFCDAGGNFGTGVTVTANTGTINWQWSCSNGCGPNTYTLNSNTSGTCCFAPKVAVTDGNADRIRFSATNLTCAATAWSSWILIQNRFAPTPTLSIIGTNPQCSNNISGNITLRANFTSAPSNFGTLEWYSGTCGGTLLGTTALTGTTTTTQYDFATAMPSTTTNYFVRYNPNSTSGGCGLLCSPVATYTVNTAMGITSITPTVAPICGSATTTLTATGVTGSAASVTWWTATGGTGQNLGTGTTLTGGGAQQYFARVTGTAPCAAAEANYTLPLETTVPTAVAATTITNFTSPANGCRAAGILLPTASDNCAGEGTATVNVVTAIPNLRLWTKADAGVVMGAGGTVSQWTDLSGNNNHFRQTTFANRPTIVASSATLNNQPALAFTSAQFMPNVTNLGAGNVAYTMFTVSRQTTLSGGRLISSASANWLMGYWNLAKDKLYCHGWISASTNNVPAADAVANIYSMTSTGSGAGSTTAMFRNGNNLNLPTPAGAGTDAVGNGPGIIQLNGWNNGLGEASAGEIAEVLYFDRVLTTTERQIIEGYLGFKYGTAVPLAAAQAFQTYVTLGNNTVPILGTDRAGNRTTATATVTTASYPGPTVTPSVSTLCSGGNVGITLSGIAPAGNKLTTTNTADWLCVGGGTCGVPGTSNLVVGPNWTIESWFEYPLPANSGSWNTLIRGTGAHHIIVDKNSALANQIGVFNGGFFTSGFNMTQLSNGWHHVTAVGTGGKTQFYIDGMFVGIANSQCTDNIVSIGNFQGGGQNFGNIDEVRIWNVALPQNTINNFMTRGITNSHPNWNSMVAYYKMDGNGANSATGTASCGSCVGSLQSSATFNTGTNYYSYNITNGTGGSLSGSNPTTAESFTVNGASTTGTVSIVASANSCNSTSTNTGTITVNALPVISTPPSTPTAICAGNGTQVLSISATGTGLSYSWRRGGTPVANDAILTGQGTNQLTLTNPTVGYAGSYDVVVSGTCTPALTSTVVTVTIAPQPNITTHPASSNACSNGATTLNVVASGGIGALNYQWQESASNCSSGYGNVGSNAASYTTGLLSAPRFYNVIVSNSGSGCNTITSNCATINIISNQASSLWIGGIGTDWFNNANWNNCLPGTNTVVTIPRGSTNYPVIINTSTFDVANPKGRAKAKSVTLQTVSGTGVMPTLNVNTNSELKVNE